MGMASIIYSELKGADGRNMGDKDDNSSPPAAPVLGNDEAVIKQAHKQSTENHRLVMKFKAIYITQ